MRDTGALAQISQARRFLEQAKDLTDIKAVKDMAEAARLYARARRLGLETENAAAEIKVRADRKLGETLATTAKNRGGQPEQRGSTPTPRVGVEQPAPTLAELGISHNESSNAQAIASLPDDVFEDVITETKEAGKPLATKPLVREGRKRKRDAAGAAMHRSRADPRPPAEQSGPVNRQNILDAQLRAAFSRAIKCVSEINALAPARVFEVLRVGDIERTEATLERLAVWLERFREARAEMRPRTVGGTRG